MSTHCGENRGFVQFLVLWSGQFVSAIGSGLTAFAVGAHVFELTGTASSYAMTLLCAFLPAFCLAPLGGVLADRYDRRLLIMIGDIGAAGGVGYVLLGILSGLPEIRQIYAGIAISSLFIAIRTPAYKATVTDMLPPQKYEQASGLVQLAASSQYLISPLLAGVMMGLMDIRHILCVDLISFVIAIATALIVRRHLPATPTAAAATGFIGEIAEGWRTIIAQKGVLNLIGITSWVLFFVGLMQCLFAPMVLAFDDVATLGIAQSVCAAGMLLGSLLIGVFGIGRNLIRVLTFFLMLMGLFYAAMGLSTKIVWVVVPGFLFFFTLPFINSCIEVLLRGSIDRDKQGRVWSLVSVMTCAGSIAAFGVAGFLADQVFNPLFMKGGALAGSGVSALTGSGPGRGIAFLFVISGLCVATSAFMVHQSKSIRRIVAAAGSAPA